MITRTFYFYVKVSLVIWGTELKMTQILFEMIFLNISEVVHVVLSKMSETNTCQISLPSSNAIIEHRVH